MPQLLSAAIEFDENCRGTNVVKYRRSAINKKNYEFVCKPLFHIMLPAIKESHFQAAVIKSSDANFLLAKQPAPRFLLRSAI